MGRQIPQSGMISLRSVHLCRRHDFQPDVKCLTCNDRKTFYRLIKLLFILTIYWKNALKCNLLQWNQNLVSFTTSLNFIFPWITYWSPNPMMVPWRSLADTILFSSWSKNKWSIDNHWHFYLPGFNYSLNSTFPCWLFVHKQNICADEHLL